MASHLNFYETVEEARMRLNRTIVCYDGRPCFVHAITNHNPDGKFRIYLDPEIFGDKITRIERFSGMPTENLSADYHSLGQEMDNYITANQNRGLLRKQMDSPKFDRFRPFPLGMVNLGARVFYLERTSTRQSNQGLNRNMICETYVTTGQKPPTYQGSNNVDYLSKEMESCILGEYPTAKACLENLKSPDCENEAAAFDRLFAFVKGPMGLIFLAYKDEIVGGLPDKTFGRVVIPEEFSYIREAVAELSLFGEIIVE